MSKGVKAALLSLGLVLMMAAVGRAQTTARYGAWGYPDLGLTDEQLDAIDAARLAFEEDILPLELERQKAQMSLDRLMRQGADRSRLNADIEALDRIDAELEKAYLEHRARIRELLTEEQRVRFDRFGGLGLGRGFADGIAPRWGLRGGAGQAYGPAWGLAPGRGRGAGRGWAPGRGWALGPGGGAGWGRGGGRGYYCPWFRWR